MARHNADFASVRRDNAGAVWPDQARFRTFEGALHLHHVQHRNTFGDADDQLHLGVNRFKDRVSREGGRHIDHRCVCFGDMLGLMDRVEHGQVQMGLTTFAWRHTTNHLRAISNGLLGMEGALAAGKALADHFGILVNEYGHVPVPLFVIRRTASAVPQR